ncbi:MAG: hypothetical protein M1816_005596 [Peltula sp. TS41687]|nr:MAG: hypothetical protein M1816_005596 [Peltula sp. TS41687]
MTKISFQALPMSQFTTLQKKVFPAYFRLQTVLILTTLATYPPMSLLSLFTPKASGARQWGDVAAFGLMLLNASLNLTLYGPKTMSAMIERTHQETRDGRKYNDKANMSDDMKRANKSFSRMHAMSIHLNLIAVLSTVWYGLSLASRLEIKS